MNSIQSTSFQSIRSDISELRENLNTHVKDREQCEEFFKLYSKQKYDQSKDLNFNQYKYSGCFFRMFSCISDDSIGKWNEKYQKISNDFCLIDSLEEKETITNELGQLESQIKESKDTNKVFCQKLILLIQKNPTIILQKESVFFLPTLEEMKGGLGECHCCPDMYREKRQIFSSDLKQEIANSFPDKKSISIASIGAGACFHELEIHMLVSEHGYLISEWTLVDHMLQPMTSKTFTTIVNWTTPSTTVTNVYQKAHEYFTSLQTSSSVPDVFLFIDMDLQIQTSEVEDYVKKMNHRCLFAYFAKNQQYGPEYYESNVT